ncbi:MAG: gamma-glutamylcyclotransferase [Gammaproteobacteria bacterium]|nr:gamma-glutamylcyclotransferase [Gammaproteobacteria bacterium]
MPLIFSYGTLQQGAVQLANFGRPLKGSSDTLAGFAEARVPIRDQALIAASGQSHHANATYTGNPRHQVAGTAFEVTEEELVMADDYEKGADYTRVSVRLASGRVAWVYIHAPSLAETPDRNDPA